MNDVIYKIAEISDIDQILKIGNLLSDFELSDNEHSFWSEETLKNCIISSLSLRQSKTETP